LIFYFLTRHSLQRFCFEFPIRQLKLFNLQSNSFTPKLFDHPIQQFVFRCPSLCFLKVLDFLLHHRFT
jgi:hypothetical protein